MNKKKSKFRKKYKSNKKIRRYRKSKHNRNYRKIRKFRNFKGGALANSLNSKVVLNELKRVLSPLPIAKGASHAINITDCEWIIPYGTTDPPDKEIRITTTLITWILNNRSKFLFSVQIRKVKHSGSTHSWVMNNINIDTFYTNCFRTKVKPTVFFENYEGDNGLILWEKKLSELHRVTSIIVDKKFILTTECIRDQKNLIKYIASVTLTQPQPQQTNVPQGKSYIIAGVSELMQYLILPEGSSNYIGLCSITWNAKINFVYLFYIFNTFKEFLFLIPDINEIASFGQFDCFISSINSDCTKYKGHSNFSKNDDPFVRTTLTELLYLLHLQEKGYITVTSIDIKPQSSSNFSIDKNKMGNVYKYKNINLGKSKGRNFMVYHCKRVKEFTFLDRMMQ